MPCENMAAAMTIFILRPIEELKVHGYSKLEMSFLS